MRRHSDLESAHRKRLKQPRAWVGTACRYMGASRVGYISYVGNAAREE